MIIHKEGIKTVSIAFLILLVLLVVIKLFINAFFIPLAIISIGLFLFIVSFFRNPNRQVHSVDDSKVYAPADGKVVVVEKTQEPEYFGDERIQVSIFMSPANVHVNRNPISGIINYFKYHPGKYLVAWHPKSSTENERTTIVIDNGKHEILLRQIAGMLAKRIVNYLNQGDRVAQGSEMGFIKFGSRVDVFLPLDAEIKVEIGQKVRGNIDIIAELKE